MARPLRVDVENGRYHVMSRGTERRTLFVDDSYSEHFLDLLEWWTDALLRRAGDAGKYRRFVQRYVTRGLKPEDFDGLGERVVLGSTAFLDKVRGWVGQVGRETPNTAALSRCVPLEAIIQAVEAVKGEPLDSFLTRHGDWGKPAVLYLARERSGLTLAEIGMRIGSMDYNAVSAAVRRFKDRLAKDHEARVVGVRL